MDEFRTISDIVAAYLPEASEPQRETLAGDLKALAAAFYVDFRAEQRFDDSSSGVVDSESPRTGL